jgi:2-polyprenyl-3-methyl-5-hydroxy-6-metoxy-1,4-benzoquinol methylase
MSNQIDTPCPICSHTPTTAPNDREYIRCLHCGVVRTRYSYDASQYREAYAHNYMKYAKTPVNLPLNLFRLGLISRWLTEGSKILDVGCCVGEFLRFAEKHYTCEGFEPNPIAAREARKRISSHISTSLNGSCNKIHCVTMFDVLEHIEEPYVLLNHIKDILVPRGIVAITTPNVACIPQWGDELLRRWKHWKPLEHLFLYEERALETMLSKTGFEILHFGSEESDIRPGNPNEDILTCVARKIE